jgi:hypothetical protein
MASQAVPVQLNSAYRNPARASGLSRHQYGDAVDFQVFDNDQDARRDDDWKILETEVRKANPSYVEPMNQSGEGHVHADWRAESHGTFDDLLIE